jgi:hypothetical protein
MQSFWRETTYGLRYISQRTGLLLLLALMSAFNFSIGLVEVLFTPMVLSVASADRLGFLLALGGVAMIVGSVAISVWGGPRRQIRAVLLFLVAAAVCVAASGVRPTMLLWTVSLCCFFFCIPFIAACSDNIWQAHVAPRDQGRVFATRSMISLSALPLSFLVAPALTSSVFEPLLAAEGPLQDNLRWLLGTAAVHGTGLAFVTTGVTILASVLLASRAPSLRVLDYGLGAALPHSTAPEALSTGPVLSPNE